MCVISSNVVTRKNEENRDTHLEQKGKIFRLNFMAQNKI